MKDFSRAWPFGLGTSLWWQPVLVALVALALATLLDAPLSVWAQSWPDSVQQVMSQLTSLGLSDWILLPSAVFFVITAGLALVVRWRLMRTMLRQFAVLYAFIFVGVGLPGLVTLVLKRVIGRDRPIHLPDLGVFGFRPNLLDWTYQSFPSGHATTIFAAATVVGFVSPRWFYPALVTAVLVGVSRVALGDHYPSDVVGGIIVGVLGAYATRWLFARRGWMFAADSDGRIHARPMSSMRRYLTLRRRRSAPKPQPDRP